MKTKVSQLLAVVCIAATLSGCATVFGGPRTSYQTTKPGPGEPKRNLRVGALIADLLLFWPGTFIDLATGAIYTPAPTTR
ncbi:MAG: hypothetical protein H7Z75_10995 [Ferruginibacter sp.]|nr:hypothetical protein [Cytophagales bacterium]